MIHPHPKPTPRAKKPRKPLRAKHWGVRTKRVKPRRSRRARDPEYLTAVRALPCLMSWNGTHGPAEAHHASINHGLGQKGSDYKAVPLCHACHRHWTDHTGPFVCMSRDDRRWRAAAWIEYTQARLGLTQEPAR